MKMQIIKIGNLTIRFDESTGDVELDTNGAPWKGKISDIWVELGALALAKKNENEAA